MPAKGSEYEVFVKNIMQAIFDTESQGFVRNIVVEHDKKIKDRSGIMRQFDVYWEYECGGFTSKNVIECKDYASSITVDKIDALIGKINDIPDLKGIFATKHGYQRGAKTKAEQNNIELIIVREQNNSDWQNKDGKPLMKKITINIIAQCLAEIKWFEACTDKEWIKANTNVVGLYSNLIIEDHVTREQYSLLDLKHSLNLPDGRECNTDIFISKKFNNAFLVNKETGLNIKINGYKCIYSIPEPIKRTIVIDGSKYISGVVEYLFKKNKTIVNKSGTIERISLSRIVDI